MTERHLENLAYPQVTEYLARGDTIVLPLGVVEPHGRHLPLGTDGYCALAAAEAIAERLDALVAPVMHYGLIDKLASYPGYTTLSEGTYAAVLRETIASLAASGFRVFVLCNGHGPNHGPACEVAREFIRKPGLFLVVVEWYALTEGLAGEMYGDQGGHAGIQETSLMLHAYPGLVRRELYDEAHAYVVRKGLTPFPLPAAMILSRPEDRPDFDRQKAARFAAEALAETAAAVEAVIRQHRQNVAG